MDIILEELNEKGAIYLNDTLVSSEKILQCLQIAIVQEKKNCVENLALYRLESLTRAIRIKKKIIERLNKKPNNKDLICELETELKIYTSQAISLMKEKVKTGRIK